MLDLSMTCLLLGPPWGPARGHLMHLTTESILRINVQQMTTKHWNKAGFPCEGGL